MKKHILLVVLSLTALCGCQQFVTWKTNHSIAGVWKSEGALPWKFVFAKNGAIKEVFRNDGLRMDISAGGSGSETSDKQVLASYVYGPCVWSYDPKTNILRATVTIEDFYVKAGDAELNCKLIDEFEGPLSGDDRTWNASWTTTTKWHDNAPDQVVADRKLVLTKIE